LFDPCIFGGVFKGCRFDYGIFWSFVTAAATVATAGIIYFQLKSLRQDSETKAAESYVNLIQIIQTGSTTGLVTQIAAVRAIRHLKFIEPSGAINDLDSTLKHFQSLQTRLPTLERELEETIAVMRNR
jgi:hypothetical protein